MTIRKHVGVVLFGGMLLASTRSEAQGEGALNAEQTAAKARFDEVMKPLLAEYRTACRADLAVTTDFENYDARAWTEGLIEADLRSGATAREKAEARTRVTRDLAENPDRAGVGSACASVVDRLKSTCVSHNNDTPRARDEKGRPLKDQPARTADVALGVKRVACLFRGYVPKPDYEDGDLHTRKNMSFANEVLTVHPHPSLRNVSESVYEAVKPKAPRKDHRLNGEACTERGQCASFACSSGTCKPCGPTVGCHASATCSGGICWLPREASDDDDRPSSSSSSSSGSSSKPSKPAGKASGSSCKFGSECSSKICNAKYRCK